MHFLLRKLKGKSDKPRMLKRSILLTLVFSTSAIFAQENDCIVCLKEKLIDTFLPKVPTVTIPLVKIEKPVLKRNKNAEYCKRDTGMIDTIVFHHTAAPPTQTTTNINNFQLTQGGSDPWLMIAYHYTITGAYPGAKTPAGKIEQGRPLDIVGSHTGTDTFATPSDAAKKVIKEKPPTCGKEGGKFVLDKKLYGKDGRSRANVSTIGVVIIGNYAPYSSKNETGYPKNKPRYPTEDMLIQAAKLSCEIQRQHPNVKFIKWHDFYKPTGCPGTVEQKIPRIVELAKGYGCDFSS